MQSIILAAGRGIRLTPAHTKATPKCMTDINGISILHYQIKQCLVNGVSKFVIVVGYEKNILIDHVYEVLSPDQVIFIENPIFHKTNTLYSLYLTKEYMNTDFVYFNADVLFHPDLLKKLMVNNNKNLLLIERKQTNEEDVKVIINNGLIKEIHKEIDILKAEGEFIGIAKFVQKDLPHFIYCLDKGVKEHQENNYFEYALNLMCSNVELYAVYTDGLPCIEIDFPDDLKKAREMFK